MYANEAQSATIRQPFLILPIAWHTVDSLLYLPLQQKWMLIKTKLWAQEGGKMDGVTYKDWGRSRQTTEIVELLHWEFLSYGKIMLKEYYQIRLMFLNFRHSVLMKPT